MKSFLFGGAVAMALLLPQAVTAQTKAKGKAPEGPAAPAAKTPTVSLKQMTVVFDPAADEKQRGEKIAAFQTATLAIFSCGDVDAAAATVGAQVQSADDLPLGALPEPLRTNVSTMKIGTATQLFGTRESGKVSVLVLCARH